MLGKNKLVIALIIIIVVMVIYYFCFYNIHGEDYEDYMYGYWVADEGFCESAEVDSILLFIGKPKGNKKRTRPAHIIMNEDIMNQKIEITYEKCDSSFSRKVDKYSFDCVIEFEEKCQIPERVKMEFDIKKGSLKIYDDDMVWALMYKDHEITNRFLQNEKQK